jgi:DNA-binding PadR family transcriptional regulator
LKQNKVDKGLDPKHILKLILFLRKNSSDSRYLTQKDIMEGLPIVRSQTSFILSTLEENKLIDINMIYTTRNTGPRKMYRLNKDGQRLARKIIDRGLNHDEKRLLDLYKKIRTSENNKILKDLCSIIQLFQVYGLNKDNFLFSEMLENFVSSVKKFFKYETQFNRDFKFETTLIKE